MMFGYPDVIVAKPIHFFHLTEHLLIEFRNRPVQVGDVGRQIMRAEFHAFARHQASQPPNFIQPDISWHRVGVNAGVKMARG
jgi:hypothetical protein